MKLSLHSGDARLSQTKKVTIRLVVEFKQLQNTTAVASALGGAIEELFI